MLFYRKVEFISPLAKGKIVSKLRGITEKKYSGLSSKFKFEGQISNDFFIIFPTFDYGPNAQLRTQIIGLIEEQDSRNKVALTFKLPTTLEVLLWVILTINIGIILYFYLNPIPDNFIFNHYCPGKFNLTVKIFEICKILRFLFLF
ncbi:MAG: hypothetical protein ACK4ND_08180 [Cytophagaceae bacterium]